MDTVIVNGEIVFSGGHSTRVNEEESYRIVSDSVIARAKRLGIDPQPEWSISELIRRFGDRPSYFPGLAIVLGNRGHQRSI